MEWRGWTEGDSVRAARAWWDHWVGTLACLAVALMSVVGLLWLRDRSQQTPLGQAIDQLGMDLVVGDQAATRRLVGLLGNVSVGSIALVVAALAVVAVLRGRIAGAVAAGVLVAGANVTTQVLKRLGDRPDFGHLTVSSFPSGHATAVTSLVLAALLVTPRAVRAATSLLGSAAITIAAAATLVASWHRPADIVGAVLVSLAWGCLVLAVWSIQQGGVPRPDPAPHRVFSLVGVVVASVLLVLVGVRPDGGWSGFLDASIVLALLGFVAVLAVTTFAHLSAPLAVGEAGRDLGVDHEDEQRPPWEGGLDSIGL